MDYRFSNKTNALKPSAIREILKATSVPGMIPFAAGNPAGEAFPVAAAQALLADIMQKEPINALQYGVSEGYAPLIEAVQNWMQTDYGIGRDFDGCIITSGAQQVVDLATKVLCNEGDVVVCENPSFIGSLNSFRSYGARLVGVDVQSDGMDIGQLEQVLKTQNNVRLIYTIPNFQNPSGVTMSFEKRKALYALAKQYGVLILEDNPYGELRVGNAPIPAIKSFDEDGLVIYAGSFSKILAPGIRVGFTVAPAALTAKMTVGKQTSDVHTPVLMQMLVNRWLREYDIPAHLANLRSIYARKLNLMCDQLEKELAGFLTFQRPQGGLFVWGELPQTVDMLGFCTTATKRNVAVVPGTAFLADESQKTQAIRLNFSTPSDEQIIKGTEILGRLAKTY